MNSLKQECGSCRGTGIYQGFCEMPGEAVICLGCRGAGWIIHRYHEFTHLKRKRGVKEVRYSQGSFIGTGVGGRGNIMTYKEFYDKMKTNND